MKRIEEVFDFLKMNNLLDKVNLYKTISILSL